jgi:Reverse transcriptase (RNA-dependent DNA polymerase)
MHDSSRQSTGQVGERRRPEGGQPHPRSHPRLRKKAFDRVPHGRLLDKLSHYGVSGILLRWTESFLKGRTQFVSYSGAKSVSREVESGVIQGSVLGPLLFIIYAADLPAVVKSEVTLYADDVIVDRIIFSAADIEELQNDLDGIAAWGAVNGMELNASKCHVLEITRSKTQLHANYFVSGTTLAYSSTERILGVHVNCKLRWNEHTDIVRAIKAAKVLSFAARNLRKAAPRASSGSPTKPW